MIKLLDIAHVVLEEQQTNEDFKKKALTAALAAATALGGVNTTSKLASIPASKVTSVQNKFTKAVRGIIDNIEGAYVNPSQLTNKREKRAFRKSGETMYGIDRKTGGSINATEEGKQFWALIDADKKKNPEKWVRYYDGGELKRPLQDLAAEIMKPQFEKLFNTYLSPEAQQIINSDPRLMFHFIYATWNGAGWFRKFANSFEEQLKKGVTNPNVLFNKVIEDRKNSGGIIGNKADEVAATAQSI